MLEQIGPHGLRTGIAAPRPPDRAGDQKQPDPRHDQHARDEVEFVRPDLDIEHVEAAIGEIDQHRLVGRVRPAVPADPRGDVVDRQRDDHDQPLEAPERAVDALVVDGLALGVEFIADNAVVGRAERAAPVAGLACRGGGAIGLAGVTHRHWPWRIARHRPPARLLARLPEPDPARRRVSARKR